MSRWIVVLVTGQILYNLGFVSQVSKVEGMSIQTLLDTPKSELCGNCGLASFNRTGCGNEGVETCVCESDPWCCVVEYDEICAHAAHADCGCIIQTDSDTTRETCGNCRIPSFERGGCSNEVVEECVCELDQFCCDLVFDEMCAFIAESICGCTILCNGQDEDCCKLHGPCYLGEGDCDYNSECAGSLICTNDDNCKSIWGDEAGDILDCCVEPPPHDECTISGRSGINHGVNGVYNCSGEVDGHPVYSCGRSHLCYSYPRKAWLLVPDLDAPENMYGFTSDDAYLPNDISNTWYFWTGEDWELDQNLEINCVYTSLHTQQMVYGT